MKKNVLILVFVLLCVAGFSQRFEVPTADGTVPFKRHFTYSIEKGYVSGVSRQVVAGNQTDWLANSKIVMGNSINSNIILNGRGVNLTGASDNILMTDFVIVSDGGESRYAAGTGIYFPGGPTGYGYVFLGIYERSSGQLTTLVYFDLMYPADVIGNTIGTRIKYGDKEKAYYICGTMVDRPFVTIDMNNIQCNTKGFIMKVLPPYNQGDVLVLDPDPLPDPRQALLCSVNDIQMNNNQSYIAFTGVSTEAEMSPYYQPMAGMIDLNLNIQWYKVYGISDIRYSGIDVEFGENDGSIFALFNSEGRAFSIMQLDLGGGIQQQPRQYLFDMPLCTMPGTDPLPAIARGHIMHWAEGNSLIVTGNTYVETDDRQMYQSLFKYDIPDANNLSSGLPTVGHYSCDPVPVGNQCTITSWWAPENSVIMDNNTYIVGAYNNPWVPEYGYNFINVNGFQFDDPHCYIPGNVSIQETGAHPFDQKYHHTITYAHDFGYSIFVWVPEHNQECPPHTGKTASVADNASSGDIWKFVSIDQGGIHAVLNPDSPCRYRIRVYDVIGRTLYSGDFDVEGIQAVYLKFNTGDQLYLISVDNGIKVETLKVPGNR